MKVCFERDETAEAVFDRFMQRYGEPTFEHFAMLCEDLRDVCKMSLVLEEQHLTEFDDIARGHLESMIDVFDSCAEKFIDCDPYYRR